MPIKNQTNYYFPHLRRGIGASIESHNASGDNSPQKRATVNVELTFHATDKDGNTADAEGNPYSRTINQPIGIYGPGDIMGFDTKRLIVRFQPAANDGNFVSNNVPFIEFSEPDFPWRYSAAKVNGHWLPWLTLIVLRMPDGEEEGEFEFDRSYRRNLPPRILLKEGVILPDLSNTWRWAHVHCSDEAGTDRRQLEEKIKNTPSFAVARLLCARRLRVGTKYTAFLVPTYQLGLEAALGVDNEQTDRSHLAWEETTAPENFAIPYYFKWTFRTGSRGDFEDMVRKIRARQLMQLSGKEINIDNPGYNFQNTDTERPRTIRIDGALQSSDQNNTFNENIPLEPEERSRLATLLEKAIVIGDDGQEKWLVVPTTYGHLVNLPEASKIALEPNTLLHPDIYKRPWLETVNLDIRYRIAAGLGAQYVKENQEELMTAAWDQLERVKEKNRALNLGRFGRQMSFCYHKRIQQVKNPKAFLSLTEPLNAKLTTAVAATGSEFELPVKTQFELSNFSNTLVNPKLRKYLRNRKTAKLDGTENTGVESFRTQNLVPPVFGASRMETSVRKWPRYRPPQTFTFGAVADPTAIPNKVIDKTNPVHTIQKGLLESLEGWKKPALRDNENANLWIDPVYPAWAHPEFHAPMYKYLLELSEEYFVPGLNEVPQNTVSALLTNRRFIEAFLLGLNHEFALELRWRGYPTDMRGSYFRKFWDTSIYALDQEERRWFRESPEGTQLLNDLSLDNTAQNWDQVEGSFFGTVNDPNLAKNYEQSVEKWMLTREEDKDIAPLHYWRKSSPLGSHKMYPTVRTRPFRMPGNSSQFFIQLKVISGISDSFKIIDNRASPEVSALLGENLQLGPYPAEDEVDITIIDSEDERLNATISGLKMRGEGEGIPPAEGGDQANEVVLLIRAELLRKFPNTFIYLLHEDFLAAENQEQYPDPVYPRFEANLPPDIFCLGFPFDEDEARKYFLLFEERASEQRFGLDVGFTPVERERDLLVNLSWEHFPGLAPEGYLDGINPQAAAAGGNWKPADWDKATFIAKAFTQRPIRMAVNLNSLLP